MEEYKKIVLDTEDLIDTFQLEMNPHQCEFLDDLLNTKGNITKENAVIVENLRLKLIEEGSFWNEEELKMNFLAFLFYVADIDVKGKIKLFYERSLSAIINHYKINVICDALIATPKGIGKPKNPYFFLQEFKKQKQQQDNGNDAEGQMLAAMLIAQFENNNNFPVYGSYLQGKFWHFTVLHHQKYCVSHSFDATNKNDLNQIIYILQNIKNLILRQING